MTTLKKRRKPPLPSKRHRIRQRHTNSTSNNQLYWMPSPSFSTFDDDLFNSSNSIDTSQGMLTFNDTRYSSSSSSSPPSPSLSTLTFTTSIKIVIQYFYRQCFINSFSKPLTQYILNVLYCFSFETYEFEDNSNEWRIFPVIRSAIRSTIIECTESEHKKKIYLMPHLSPTLSYTVDSLGYSIGGSNDHSNIIHSSCSESSDDTDEDYVLLSFQVSNSPSSPLFPPSTPSFYHSNHSNSNSGLSNRRSFYNEIPKSSLVTLSNGTQCTAKLDSNVNWNTVFFGPLLYQELFGGVFVVNLIIDQSAYGLGIAFFGLKKNNEKICTKKYLKNIITNKNGLADDVNDCFVIYDNGEYHDWNDIKSNDLKNVNEEEPISEKPKFKTMNKLGSKYINLRKIKKECLLKKKKSLTPICTSIDESDDHHFIDSEVDMMTKIRIRKKNVYNWYHRSSQKKLKKKQKKIYRRFGFEAKCDLLQISFNFCNDPKIVIHNLTTHQCLVLSNFDYEAIRMAFVMRNAEITIIDQKWYS